MPWCRSILPEARGRANRVDQDIALLLLHVFLERGQITKGFIFIASPAPKDSRNVSSAAANGILCGGSLEGPAGLLNAHHDLWHVRGVSQRESLQENTKHFREVREASVNKGGGDLWVLRVHTVLLQTVQTGMQHMERGREMSLEESVIAFLSHVNNASGNSAHLSSQKTGQPMKVLAAKSYRI